MCQMAIENIKIAKQDESDASSNVNVFKRLSGDFETKQKEFEDKQPA